MNENVSLYNRFVVIGCAVALFVMMANAAVSGWGNQPADLLTGQDGQSAHPYAEVEMLAGPVVGNGGGGG